MKTVEYKQGGTTYYLALNGAALIDLYEHFGKDAENSVLDPIYGVGRTAFNAVCWMLAKFAEQGELIRRDAGFKPQNIPTDQHFKLKLRPMELHDAKEAIKETVILGFKRECQENEEVDLVLEEIEKKTESS